MKKRETLPSSVDEECAGLDVLCWIVCTWPLASDSDIVREKNQEKSTGSRLEQESGLPKLRSKERSGERSHWTTPLAQTSRQLVGDRRKVHEHAPRSRPPISQHQDFSLEGSWPRPTILSLAFGSGSHHQWRVMRRSSWELQPLAHFFCFFLLSFSHSTFIIDC